MNSSNKIIRLAVLSLLLGCNSEVPVSSCNRSEFSFERFNWSFVDQETEANLMGRDGQLIHPDSIFILSSQLDTIETIAIEFDDWWSVGLNLGLSDELYAFNNCLLDSSKSNFYYLYIGNNDWDTLEIRFQADPNYSKSVRVLFNGKFTSAPKDLKQSEKATSYWFWKESNVNHEKPNVPSGITVVSKKWNDLNQTCANTILELVVTDHSKNLGISYDWSVQGATILSGHGTESIFVKIPDHSDIHNLTFAVRAKNSLGSSFWRVLNGTSYPDQKGCESD